MNYPYHLLRRRLLNNSGLSLNITGDSELKNNGPFFRIVKNINPDEITDMYSSDIQSTQILFQHTNCNDTTKVIKLLPSDELFVFIRTRSESNTPYLRMSYQGTLEQQTPIKTITQNKECLFKLPSILSFKNMTL